MHHLYTNCIKPVITGNFVFKYQLKETIESGNKMWFSHWLQCKCFWGITSVIGVRITQPRRFYIVYSMAQIQKEFNNFYCMSHMKIYMQVPPIGLTFNFEWTISLELILHYFCIKSSWDIIYVESIYRTIIKSGSVFTKHLESDFVLTCWNKFN